MRSCPTGRCRYYARAGRISPSATQQGTSQIKGHDPRAAIPACKSDQRCNWPDTPTRVGGKGMPKEAKKRVARSETERAAMRELVKAARSRGWGWG